MAGKTGGSEPEVKLVAVQPGVGGRKAEPGPGASEPEVQPVAGQPESQGQRGEGSLTTGGDEPVGTLPDVESLVAEAVKAAKAELTAKYEGKDGDIAKLKRSYQKQLNELREAQSADAERVIDQAMQLAESDPTRALEMLGTRLQSYQQRDARSVHQAQMAEWAERVAGEFGLDVDDEDVAALIEEVGPLTDPAASHELLGSLGKLAKEREAARAKSAEQKLAEFETNLTEQVQQLVAAAMAERAGPVETREPTAPRVQEEDLTKRGVGSLLGAGLASFRANQKGGRGGKQSDQ